MTVIASSYTESIPYIITPYTVTIAFAHWLFITKSYWNPKYRCCVHESGENLGNHFGNGNVKSILMGTCQKSVSTVCSRSGVRQIMSHLCPLQQDN